MRLQNCDRIAAGLELLCLLHLNRTVSGKDYILVRIEAIAAKRGCKALQRIRSLPWAMKT